MNFNNTHDFKTAAYDLKKKIQHDIVRLLQFKAMVKKTKTT